MNRVATGIAVNAAIAVSLLASAGAGAQEASHTPASALRVVDQRAIEIPDARIISMSPDGHWLLAARPAGDFAVGELCVFAVDTLAERACGDLSVLGAGIRLEDVTWSSDSTRIAFSERGFVTFEDGDLWLMDAATGALSNLDDDGFSGRIPLLSGEWPDEPVTLPVNPAFSPDGTTIAFSRSIMDGPKSRRNVIATVPVTGGEVTELVTVADQIGIAYFGLAWAPDGSRIYFSVHQPKERDPGNGVWVVDAKGGDAQLLVGHYQDSYGPAVLQVSNDGETLLLQDPAAFGQFAPQFPIYATADTANGVPTPLVPLSPEIARGAVVAWAGLSPDGGSVLTLYRRSSPDLQAWARDVGGSVEVPLVPEGLPAAGPIERGLAPTWATNGTIFLTGAASYSTGTLLTIEGAGAAP
jgi:dipeptidyl aminopeptidase/acylaminoacyl peptidase